MENFRKSFFELIDASSSVIITSHISPDDDSIASVLSMYSIISNYKTDLSVRIIYTGIMGEESKKRYRHFSNFEKIEFTNDLSENIKSGDTVIFLDGSQYYRFSNQPERIGKDNTLICIDHHSSPSDHFTLKFIESSISSNAENIYRIFFSEKDPSVEVAKCLLLGILGDTGGLRYVRPDQTETFLITKKLLEIIGMSMDKFNSGFSSTSRPVFEVIQEYIKNTVFDEVPGWPPFQYSYISERFIENGFFDESTVGVGNTIYKSQYIRTIEKYPWGFVLRPKNDGTFSVSFRSLQDSVNVRDLAERMKIGGGHDRAAGAHFKKTDGYGSVSACVDAIKEFMRNNKPLIS